MPRHSNVYYLPKRKRDRWALVMIMGTVITTVAAVWYSNYQAAIEWAQEDLNAEIRGYAAESEFEADCDCPSSVD